MKFSLFFGVGCKWGKIVSTLVVFCSVVFTFFEIFARTCLLQFAGGGGLHRSFTTIPTLMEDSQFLKQSEIVNT